MSSDESDAATNQWIHRAIWFLLGVLVVLAVLLADPGLIGLEPVTPEDVVIG